MHLLERSLAGGWGGGGGGIFIYSCSKKIRRSEREYMNIYHPPPPPPPPLPRINALIMIVKLYCPAFKQLFILCHHVQGRSYNHHIEYLNFFSLHLGSSKLAKCTLLLDSEETVFRFEYESLGRRKTQKTFLKGN